MLVPEVTVDKWYIEGNFVFECFRSIFVNDLWDKQYCMPRGMSVCPYFWISMLIGGIGIKLVLLPIYRVAKGIIWLGGRPFVVFDRFLRRLLDKLEKRYEFFDFPRWEDGDIAPGFGIGALLLMFLAILLICLFGFGLCVMAMLIFFFFREVILPSKGLSFVAAVILLGLTLDIFITWYKKKYCVFGKERCKVEIFVPIWQTVVLVIGPLLCYQEVMISGKATWIGLAWFFGGAWKILLICLKWIVIYILPVLLLIIATGAVLAVLYYIGSLVTQKTFEKRERRQIRMKPPEHEWIGLLADAVEKGTNWNRLIANFLCQKLIKKHEASSDEQYQCQQDLSKGLILARSTTVLRQMVKDRYELSKSMKNLSYHDFYKFRRILMERVRITNFIAGLEEALFDAFDRPVAKEIWDTIGDTTVRLHNMMRGHGDSRNFDEEVCKIYDKMYSLDDFEETVIKWLEAQHLQAEADAVRRKHRQKVNMYCNMIVRCVSSGWCLVIHPFVATKNGIVNVVVAIWIAIVGFKEKQCPYKIFQFSKNTAK